MNAVERVDTSSRIVRAGRDAVFRAMTQPQALVEWLPPTGMSGRFEHADIRTGGSYRLVLTFDEPTGTGKATADSDVVEVGLVEVSPEQIVQEVGFVSDDPAYSGTMTMTWRLTPVDDGTLVEIRAEGVPSGVSAEDHATGMSASLVNLAAYLET